MAGVTLAPGDVITFTQGGKEHSGTIRDVIKSSENSYLLTLDSNDLESPITLVRIENKLVVYMSF